MKIPLLSSLLFVYVLSFGQVPNYVPSNGLVGWWGFNGNANDASVNTNDGTVNGATLTTDRFGNINSAYYFDGSSYISVADNPILNWGFGDYTISVWVNKDNSSPFLQNIIAKQETTGGNYYGWSLGLVDNEVRFVPGTGYNGTWLNNGTIESDYLITDNQWYFITGVFDFTNSTTSLYINGQLYISTTASNTINPDNSQDLKFGVFMPSGAPSGPEYFFGNIDDIGIWNRALSSTEIIELFLSVSCTPNPIILQPSSQSVNLGDDAIFLLDDTLIVADYQWQMDAGTGFTNLSNAGQFSGTDSKILTISSTSMSNNNTLYRCVITESANCIDTTDVVNLTVIDITSISELNNSLVRLFPNPSNDIITLTQSQVSNGLIILTDFLGKEVLSKSFISNEVQLNLKNLESKGTYFAKVLDLDGNVIAIKKLIYQ